MSTPLIAPTLQSLIEAERDMLNQPDPNNSFWSDTELTRYNNEAIRILMAELSSVNEGQGATVTSLNIVSGADTIALPSDFFVCLGLFKVLPTQNIRLPYINDLTKSYYTSAGTNSETYVPYYFFRGNNIVLRPPPTFNETGGLLLEYIQLPAALTDGADQVTNQICVLFFQCIEKYAIYQAKLKESLCNGVSVHENALANFADLFKQFRELSSKRSRFPTYVVPWEVN